MSRARSGPIATEAQVLRGVLRLLALEGVPAWRQQAGKVRVRKGEHEHWMRLAPASAGDVCGWLPRRFGINAGRHIEIETKRPGGRFRPGQLRHLQAVNADGGIGFWTSDLTTVMLVLEWLGRGRRVEIAVADDGDQLIDFASEEQRS